MLYNIVIFASIQLKCNMKDKTLLVVGGTDGIGKEIALKAGSGNTVIIVGRSEAKGNVLLSKYPNWYFYPTDLSEMKNVTKLADKIGANHNEIDYFVHTADVLLDKRVETREGLEISIATNFYARVLLNHLLLTNFNFKPSRIMHIALAGAPFGHKTFVKDFPLAPEVNSAKGHMVGQVANDAYGLYMQRLLKNNTKVNILNPGMVDTNIRRNGELPTMMKWLMPIFSLMRPFIETKPHEYAEIPFSILEGRNEVANANVLISPKGGKAKASKVVSSIKNQTTVMRSTENQLSEIIKGEVQLIS
ncbi:MAG: SDR family NAD(P)-dependent oxidoreductase [Bacteroidota bacterium]